MKKRSKTPQSFAAERLLQTLEAYTIPLAYSSNLEKS